MEEKEQKLCAINKCKCYQYTQEPGWSSGEVVREVIIHCGPDNRDKKMRGAGATSHYIVWHFLSCYSLWLSMMARSHCKVCRKHCQCTLTRRGEYREIPAWGWESFRGRSPRELSRPNAGICLYSPTQVKVQTLSTGTGVRMDVVC